MANELERFWTHVDQSGGAAACWPWTSARDKDGYGIFETREKTVRATRYLMRSLGHDVSGRFVLHNCDNPSCMNPAHLRVGTARENSADMKARGRSLTGDRNPARQRPETRPRGDSHSLARLTSQQVQTIRVEYANGTTQIALARRFGVGESTIGSVVRRETWRHV